MRSNYNIKDAKDDLKALNAHLVEMGELLQRKELPYDILEGLMEDAEFSRLMSNISFFLSEGNKYLAEVYESKARHYRDKAGK